MTVSYLLCSVVLWSILFTMTYHMLQAIRDQGKREGFGQAVLVRSRVVVVLGAVTFGMGINTGMLHIYHLHQAAVLAANSL